MGQVNYSHPLPREIISFAKDYFCKVCGGEISLDEIYLSVGNYFLGLGECINTPAHYRIDFTWEKLPNILVEREELDFSVNEIDYNIVMYTDEPTIIIQTNGIEEAIVFARHHFDFSNFDPFKFHKKLTKLLLLK